MLITSPLLVTVGLSLSIPLALFGQILLNSQTSSFVYWIGAILVLGAFLLISSRTQASKTVSIRVNEESPRGFGNEPRRHEN